MTKEEADVISEWLNEDNNVKAYLSEEKDGNGFELTLFRESEDGKIVFGFTITPSDTN